MNNTAALINAIQEMNIELLDLILDDNQTYLEVPKDLFLSTLSSSFDKLKNKGISQFNKVSKGTCQKCYKGYAGYTFTTENNDYLDLLFEEKDGEITDIIQCTTFKNAEQVVKEKKVFLFFNKDLRTTYNPTSLQSHQQREIEKAETQFKKFENQIITLDTLETWLNQYKDVSDSVRYMYMDYSFVPSFITTYNSIQSIHAFKIEKELVEKALNEFNTFDILNEKDLIKWLIKYKENECFNAPPNYEKTESWKKTNLILFKSRDDTSNYGLKQYNNIIIDLSGYINSLQFAEVYKKYYYKYYSVIEK